MVLANSEEVETKETLIMANNLVVIQNGVIVNNPFSQRLEMSHATQWLVENQVQVKKKIGYWFREMYVYAYGGNVEDCFGLAIDYFTESKRRAFRKGYFGKESTYSVKNYCLSQLKYVVQNYVKSLRAVEVSSIVTSGEMEGSRNGVIDETISDKEQLSVDELAIARDIELWDEQFQWLMDYEDYFLDKNYKPFDLEGYLMYMYLNVQSEDIETHAEYVAKKIGESVELVRLVTADFRRDVMKRDTIAMELLSDIGNMVEAVKCGWKPKRIREEEKRKNQELERL